MCDCCHKEPVKISRVHKPMGNPQAFYLCFNCSLLDEKDFWRAFLNHFMRRQLNRKNAYKEFAEDK